MADQRWEVRILDEDSKDAEREEITQVEVRTTAPDKASATELRVVQGAFEGLAGSARSGRRPSGALDGGRPTVRFRINPRLLAGPA